MTQTAREKFKVNDTVKASEKAKHSGFDLTVGIVTGFGHDESNVRVILPRHKTPTTFHMDFWEVDRDEPCIGFGGCETENEDGFGPALT